MGDKLLSSKSADKRFTSISCSGRKAPRCRAVAISMPSFIHPSEVTIYGHFSPQPALTGRQVVRQSLKGQARVREKLNRYLYLFRSCGVQQGSGNDAAQAQPVTPRLHCLLCGPLDHLTGPSTATLRVRHSLGRASGATVRRRSSFSCRTPYYGLRFMGEGRLHAVSRVLVSSFRHREIMKRFITPGLHL